MASRRGTLNFVTSPSGLLVPDVVDDPTNERTDITYDIQAATGDGWILTTDGGEVVWAPPASGNGAKTLEFKVISDTATLTTGDGQIVVCIPIDLNGWNLTACAGFVTTVSSSGTPTVQIRNVTQSADMLTTKITIDASEFTSYTAATPPVIDTGNDDVATGDLIAVDIDVAGTGAKGLGVILTFEEP